MSGTTYSFLEVAATLAGPGGYISLGDGSGAAEEGITISAAGDINTMQVGADGSGQHSLHGDKSGTVTVRLLKTSPTNALLAAMYAFQTASAANHGQNTLVVTDTARGDVISCRQVAFKKAPDLTYAKDAGTNEWVFDAVFIDRALG
jgi:hypothetical protein